MNDTKDLKSVLNNIERNWIKQGVNVDYDHNGFLMVNDPITKTSNVMTYEEISSEQCVVLLGGASQGKSKVLMDAFHSGSQNGDASHFFYNLAAYSSEQRLISDVFKNEEINNWVLGDFNLYLYFDNIDRCYLNISSLYEALYSQLQKFQHIVNRLYIRIASRSGLWSPVFFENLKTLMGNDSVAVYEIAPLSYDNILEATEHIGLMQESFLNEVREKELQVPASNIQVLEYLISEFNKDKGLRKTKEEYYFQACRILNSRQSTEKLLHHHRMFMSVERRIAITSRIAAIMVFCNKTIVEVDCATTSSDEVLTIDMISEGVELFNDHSFEFTASDVLYTVIDSGLFHRVGGDQFAFIAYEYTEFLAARYIASHRLHPKQILSLLTLSTDADNKIIPRMKRVSAWITSIVQDQKTGSEIISIDPQNALSVDTCFFSDKQKEALVTSLLNKFENVEIDDSDWGLHAHYKTLRHPDISDQLKPYLEDLSRYVVARRVAIEIASECVVSNLFQPLIKIAENKSDNIYIRKEAVQALQTFDDIEEIKRRLMPILDSSLEEDFEDELKGSILTLFWDKRLITIESIFNYITPRKRDFYSGSYSFFLFRFKEFINGDSINIALEWLLQYYDANSEDHYLDDWESRIISLGWKEITSKTDIGLFSIVIKHRVKNHRDIYL